MAKKKKKVVLYLHVDFTTKAWLKKLCKEQAERTSQSTMVERILTKTRATHESVNTTQ